MELTGLQIRNKEMLDDLQKTIKEFEMIKDKLSEYLSESEINIITSICVDIYFCDYEKMLTDEKQIITISGDCFIELF